MLTVVAYDIVDDRRRVQVSSLLEDHGWRVNYSVFECELNGQEFERLQAQLARLIDMRKDRIVCYRLCESCRPRKKVIGQAVDDGGKSPPGVVFV